MATKVITLATNKYVEFGKKLYNIIMTIYLSIMACFYVFLYKTLFHNSKLGPTIKSSYFYLAHVLKPFTLATLNSMFNKHMFVSWHLIDDYNI